MAGVKGRSGGKRPNSGRPRTGDLEYQDSMRALVQKVVTPEDWERVIAVRLSFAKAGNAEAFRDLEKWVMGPPPKELTLKSDADAPFRIEIVQS